MRAVILAAGEGARLRPLTHALPKPMIRVANRPIAAYAVEGLVANGLTDITFVAGYHRERLQSYFEDGSRFGASIRYVFQELLLGTAHALAQVPADGEPMVVMGGDNVVDAHLLRDLLDARGDLRMAVQASANPSKYGVVTLDKARVARIEEQPRDFQSELVNTGVYLLPADFPKPLQERVHQGMGGLTHVLQDLIESGEPVTAVQSRGLWMDAVYPWDLLGVNDALVQRAVDGEQRPPRPEVEGPAGVGHGTTLRRTASLVGPALVGEGCVIEPGAYVGPATSIGDSVVVGANSVVENCILMDHVRVGPGSVLRNTILAEGVVTGPRFTALSGPSEARADDGWHALDDFGCVVGQDTIIGGNVTIEPGVTVGAGSQLASGVWLRRSVDDGAVVQA